MAYLVLSNGTVFEGKRIGAPVDRIGELDSISADAAEVIKTVLGEYRYLLNS